MTEHQHRQREEYIEWDPTRYFRHIEPRVPYVLLVLNQVINDKALAATQEYASAVICADGGANRYYDLKKFEGEEDTSLPSAIIGDLDSIRPEVRRHYEDRGVSVLYDPDQYSTDFTKCLNYIRRYADMIAPSPSLSDSMPRTKLQGQSRNGDGRNTRATSIKTPKDEIGALPTLPPTHLDVLVLGGLGGRVDQAFSQIHHLYSVALHNSHQPSSSPSASIHPHEPKENKTRSHIHLFLISEESISFILLPGLNRILTSGTYSSHTMKPSKAKEEGLEQDQEFYLSENVGIIPLTGPATITTIGLEWDVTDWKTEIGGQISTSNHIRADEVNVTTTRPVLFTVEFAARFKIGWEWKKEYC